MGKIEINMTYLNRLTVPEKLEVLSLASVLKSKTITEREKSATLLSIFIDNDEMAKLISKKFSGNEYGKKDFFDKFMQDDVFYNSFKDVNAVNFLKEIENGVNAFVDNLDLENDLSFEYVTADESQVSIINPFKGINGESGNTENFSYYFNDEVKVEDFNKICLPKVLKGFKTVNAYVGTNKRGRILYRTDKSRSLDYRKTTNKFALIKNLYYLLARKERDNQETRNIFINNIRNRRLQVRRVRSAIGKLAVNSKLTADDQDKRRYKMESSVERIGNFVYDSVLYSLTKSKKFNKATINHFSEVYGKEYLFEEFQNIKLLAAVLATKYIIQYVDFEKYATNGTNKALQDKLDNIIGKVCHEVGYSERMFAPAHVIAKKLCKDFFKNNKESFNNIATVYTGKKADDNLVSLDDAMFRTIYDPNNVNIYLQQKAMETNPDKEPFKEEEKEEEQVEEAIDDNAQVQTDDLNALDEDKTSTNEEKEEVAPIEVEETPDTKDANDEEDANKDDNYLCTPKFKELYVIHSRKKILEKLRELKEANKEETPDAKEENNIDNSNTDNSTKDDENSYYYFISEADLVKTFADANINQDDAKDEEENQETKVVQEINEEEKHQKEENNDTNKDSQASSNGTTRVLTQEEIDRLKKIAEFETEKIDDGEAKVALKDVKDKLYDTIGDLSNKIIVGLGGLSNNQLNSKNEKEASATTKEKLVTAYTAFKKSITQGVQPIDNLSNDNNPYKDLYRYAYDFIKAIDYKYGKQSTYAEKISEALADEIVERFTDYIKHEMEDITVKFGQSSYFRLNSNRGKTVKSILSTIIKNQMKEIYFDLGKLSAEEKSQYNMTRFKNTRDALLLASDATNKKIDDHEGDRRIKGGASYEVQLLDCAKAIKEEIAGQIKEISELEISEQSLTSIYGKQIKDELRAYINNHLLTAQVQDFSQA